MSFNTITTTTPVSIYKSSILTRVLNKIQVSRASEHITRQTLGTLTDASINLCPRRIRKERHTNVTSLSVTLKDKTSLADIAAALSLFPNTQSLTIVFDDSYECSSLERPVDLPGVSTILPNLRLLNLVGCENLVGQWIADTCLGLTELEIQDTPLFYMLRDCQVSPIIDTLLSANDSTLERFNCDSIFGFCLNRAQLGRLLDTYELSVPLVYGGAKIVGANVRSEDYPDKHVNYIQLHLADEFGVATESKNYHGGNRATLTSGAGIETVFL